MQRLSTPVRFFPVVVLLGSTFFVLEARGREEILPPHENLSTFPMQIADRHARDLPMSPDELEVLGPGDFLMRDYASMSGGSPRESIHCVLSIAARGRYDPFAQKLPPRLRLGANRIRSHLFAPS